MEMKEKEGKLREKRENEGKREKIKAAGETT